MISQPAEPLHAACEMKTVAGKVCDGSQQTWQMPRFLAFASDTLNHVVSVDEEKEACLHEGKCLQSLPSIKQRATPEKVKALEKEDQFLCLATHPRKIAALSPGSLAVVRQHPKTISSPLQEGNIAIPAPPTAEDPNALKSSRVGS